MRGEFRQQHRICHFCGDEITFYKGEISRYPYRSARGEAVYACTKPECIEKFKAEYKYGGNKHLHTDKLLMTDEEIYSDFKKKGRTDAALSFLADYNTTSMRHIMDIVNKKDKEEADKKRVRQQIKTYMMRKLVSLHRQELIEEVCDVFGVSKHYAEEVYFEAMTDRNNEQREAKEEEEKKQTRVRFAEEEEKCIWRCVQDGVSCSETIEQLAQVLHKKIDNRARYQAKYYQILKKHKAGEKPKFGDDSEEVKPLQAKSGGTTGSVKIEYGAPMPKAELNEETTLEKLPTAKGVTAYYAKKQVTVLDKLIKIKEQEIENLKTVKARYEALAREE